MGLLLLLRSSRLSLSAVKHATAGYFIDQCCTKLQRLWEPVLQTRPDMRYEMKAFGLLVAP